MATIPLFFSLVVQSINKFGEIQKITNEKWSTKSICKTSIIEEPNYSLTCQCRRSIRSTVTPRVVVYRGDRSNGSGIELINPFERRCWTISRLTLVSRRRERKNEREPRRVAHKVAFITHNRQRPRQNGPAAAVNWKYVKDNKTISHKT